MPKLTTIKGKENTKTKLTKKQTGYNLAILAILRKDT